MKRVNFITVLCDGVTNAAIIEKECVFVLFVDPDNFTPSIPFYSLKDAPSQNAKGIETAIRQAFVENDSSHLVFCMFFFASDGANVNSGLTSGLVTLFQKSGLQWVAFVCCISHRLDLALKDSLVNAMSDIHDSVNLFVILIQEDK